MDREERKPCHVERKIIWQAARGDPGEAGEVNGEAPEDYYQRCTKPDQTIGVWTLGLALALIRELTPALKHAGFSLGLCGSVLVDGASKSDLDIIVFPMNASTYNVRDARRVLEEYGLKPLLPRHEVAATWARKGSDDTKHVETWSWERRRIDLFFMR